MAELSWPSPDNGRVVDEEQFEQMSAHNTEDGFYMNPGGSLIDIGNQAPVFANGSSPRRAYIRANRYASVRGFGYWSGETDVPLDIAENLSGTVRVDRIALELNRATWNVRGVVVQGVPGGSWPTLTRDEGPAGVFQVPVANVLVDSGVSVITANKIYTTGHRVGSRVRAWKRDVDIDYPKLGEVGYAEDTASWFGWDGDQIRNIASDTGWVNLSFNGGNGDAWNSAGHNRVRAINGLVNLQVNVTRWSSSGLTLSDDDGSTPFVLPSGFRPAAGPVLGYGNHSRSAVILYIYPNGDVRIYPMNTDMPANRRVYAGAIFPIG